VAVTIEFLMSLCSSRKLKIHSALGFMKSCWTQSVRTIVDA
jgi:hypothetical protein